MSAEASFLYRSIIQSASCIHIADHTSECGTAKTFERVEHPFEISEVLPATACSSAFPEDSRQRATPPRGSGIDRILQATRNKLQHSLIGNTSTRVLISRKKFIPEEDVTSSTPSTSIPNSVSNVLSQPATSSPSQTLPLLSTTPLPTCSRAQLLLYRRQSPSDTLALTQDITLPFTCLLAANASHHKSRSRRRRHKTTPPITGAACSATATSKRTGRRVKFRSFDGSSTFFCKPKQNRRHYNSRICLFSSDNPRTPPPRGMPGASFEAHKECLQTGAEYNAASRGSRRRFARRAYRSWRAGCKLSAQRGGGLPCCRSASVHKATLRKARWFRENILRLEIAPRNKKPKPSKHKTTPPLAYHAKLRIGALNVQGMAETLKLKSILQIMHEQNLDVVMLSETRSTSYYSYSSEGFLVVLSGNSRDKHAGVGAVIHPKIRPHLSDIIQLSNRILHLTFNKKGGSIHVIGAYAPHSGHDHDTVREPFWNQLEEHIDKLPQPEPVYLTGDFNVRFQEQHPKDDGVTGPYTYGKGMRFIDHSQLSNRTLCVNTMRTLDMIEVASYKTPSQVHHITYRDKAAPPKDWSQYVLDPLIMQQFYAHLSSKDPIEALPVAARIRSYLDLPTPLPPPATTPHPDPVLFQRLDHTFTRKQWLSSVNSCRAKLHTGFPSDHYLLVTEVQVKLAKRTKGPPPPPRYDLCGLSPQAYWKSHRRFLPPQITPRPLQSTQTAPAAKAEPPPILEQGGDGRPNRRKDGWTRADL